MLRLFVGRFVGWVVLVLVLTLLTYVIFATIPLNAVGLSTPEGWTPEQAAEARQRLGLDQPVLQQWGSFVWDLGTEGSLGHTLNIRGIEYPINDVLWSRLPATVSLAVGGLVLTLLLAVPLGMLSAMRRRSLLDRGVLFFVTIGIVLHPFAVGLALKHVFSDRLGLAPADTYCPLTSETQLYDYRGVTGTCGGLVDWAHHLWLPWLTFALFFLPIYARLVRARSLESLGELYVLTARAKGASEARVVTRHVSRNALGPVAAMVAVDAGTIIVAAIYVETVFGLNGIGLLVVNNLSGQYGTDRNVMVGVVVLTALVVTVANLFADLSIRRLDPRVRLGRAAS